MAPNNVYWQITYQTYLSVSGTTCNFRNDQVMILSPDLPGAITKLTAAGIDPSRILNCQKLDLLVL